MSAFSESTHSFKFFFCVCVDPAFILGLLGEKTQVITHGTCILTGKTLHNVTSASSRMCGAHRINNKNLNTTPQVEIVLLSGQREGKTTSNLFTQIHSLLNYSDKDYATCPNNLHTLSGTLF